MKQNKSNTTKQEPQTGKAVKFSNFSLDEQEKIIQLHTAGKQFVATTEDGVHVLLNGTSGYNLMNGMSLKVRPLTDHEFFQIHSEFLHYDDLVTVE